MAVSYVTGNMPRRYRTIPQPDTDAPLLTRPRPGRQRVLDKVEEIDPATLDEAAEEADEFEIVANELFLEAVDQAVRAGARR